MKHAIDTEQCPPHPTTINNTSVMPEDICPGYATEEDFFRRQRCQQEAFRQEQAIYEYNDFLRRCKAAGESASSPVASTPDTFAPTADAGGLDLAALLADATQRAAAKPSVEGTLVMMKADLLQSAKAKMAEDAALQAEAEARKEAARLQEEADAAANEAEMDALQAAVDAHRAEVAAQAEAAGTFSLDDCQQQTTGYTYNNATGAYDRSIVYCGIPGFTAADLEGYPDTRMLCTRNVFSQGGQRYRKCQPR
jgi:hypothetical protein